MLARLLYGFRVSLLFGLALTFVGTVLGVLAGALQGYFGGRVDLAVQRFIEVWTPMPELYLLIIFASIFSPTLLLLIVLFRCSAGSGWPTTCAPSSCATATWSTSRRRGRWGCPTRRSCGATCCPTA